MPKASWTRGNGPLAPFGDGFRQELLRRSYTPGAVKHHLVLMGQLNGWLAAEGLGAGELTTAVAGRFLDDRRARGQRRVPTLVMLAPLFAYLRGQDVLPPEDPRGIDGP